MFGIKLTPILNEHDMKLHVQVYKWERNERVLISEFMAGRNDGLWFRPIPSATSFVTLDADTHEYVNLVIKAYFSGAEKSTEFFNVRQ